MKEEKEHSNDEELRDRIISGIRAFEELHHRFRKKLEIYLLSYCSKIDGRSRERAVEIASQVLADCFSGSPSLLEKWRGPGNLEAFLRVVALNRLKSWWNSRDARLEVDSESRSIMQASTSGEPEPLDPEELQGLREALGLGVKAAMVDFPEGLLFMRLKGLYGVDQRVISTVWGHHESKISRRITEAMDFIRTTASGAAADAGLQSDFPILLKALQGNPGILLGDVSDSLGSEDTKLLRQLAKGTSEQTGRDRAAFLMCRNSKALEYFARLLKRKNSCSSAWVRDPALDGVSARISSSMRETLEILGAVELRELIQPLIAGHFGDILQKIAADGGTLWWLSPGEAALEAVFNPLEPEITGKRQPLVSGIISLVIATSETVCVDAATCHGAHSPVIDNSLGATTKAMIALPFRLLGQTRGVLTAVRLSDGKPFGRHETDIMERQKCIIEALLVASLTAKITGAEDLVST